MADRPLSIDIRRPLLLKANDLVLLTGQDGNIADDFPGFGLFFRDTCYLSIYELLLHGTKPMLLMASDAEGMAAAVGLTNAALAAVDGGVIPDHKLSLRRTLLLEDGPAFIDTITIGNFTGGAVTLPVSLAFRAAFEDMFVLRGTPGGKRGRLRAPKWDGTALRLCYEGADGVRRTLLADFSLPPVMAPCTTEQAVAHFELHLPPGGSQDLVVTVRVDERPVADAPTDAARAPRSADAIRADKEAAAALLPDGVDTLAIHGIRAGGGTAALRFTRTGGTVATEVLAATGIEVAVE